MLIAANNPEEQELEGNSFGFNTAMQHQVIEALLRIAPEATLAISRDFLLQLVENVPSEWLREHFLHLNKTFRFYNIVKQFKEDFLQTNNQFVRELISHDPPPIFSVNEIHAMSELGIDCFNQDKFQQRTIDTNILWETTVKLVGIGAEDQQAILVKIKAIFNVEKDRAKLLMYYELQGKKRKLRFLERARETSFHSVLASQPKWFEDYFPRARELANWADHELPFIKSIRWVAFACSTCKYLLDVIQSKEISHFLKYPLTLGNPNLLSNFSMFHEELISIIARQGAGLLAPILRNFYCILFEGLQDPDLQRLILEDESLNKDLKKILFNYQNAIFPALPVPIKDKFLANLTQVRPDLCFPPLVSFGASYIPYFEENRLKMIIEKTYFLDEESTKAEKLIRVVPTAILDPPHHQLRIDIFDATNKTPGLFAEYFGTSQALFGQGDDLPHRFLTACEYAEEFAKVDINILLQTIARFRETHDILKRVFPLNEDDFFRNFREVNPAAARAFLFRLFQRWPLEKILQYRGAFQWALAMQTVLGSDDDILLKLSQLLIAKGYHPGSSPILSKGVGKFDSAEYITIATQFLEEATKERRL